MSSSCSQLGPVNVPSSATNCSMSAEHPRFSPAAVRATRDLDRRSSFPCDINERNDREEGRDCHDGQRDRVDRDNKRIGGYHIHAVVGLITALPLTPAQA
jgi:hypothetical protein